MPVERDKIDRIEQQRSKPAVAHRRRDDLAREWKQQARAFDQNHGLNALGRHVLDAENAGKDEFEVEQQHALGFGFAFQAERNLEIGSATGPH